MNDMNINIGVTGQTEYHNILPTSNLSELGSSLKNLWKSSFFCLYDGLRTWKDKNNSKQRIAKEFIKFDTSRIVYLES